MSIQEELVKGDPTNPQWESYAVPNYAVLADILQALNRPTDALAYYQKAFDARRDLAIRALGNPDLHEKLAMAGKALGDHTSGLAQIEAYRTSTLTLKRMFGTADGASRAANHYCDILTFAYAFDAAKDWPDAETAFGLAERIARTKLAADPANAAWRENAEAAAKEAAAEGMAAENAAKASANKPKPAKVQPVCLARSARSSGVGPRFRRA